MPVKVCSQCRSQFATRRGRCPECNRKHEASTHQTGRLTPTSGRLYNSKRWLVLRARRLTIEPLCRTCNQEGTETLATQVDHIVAVEDGGEPWKLDNLQSLCSSHHSAKSIAEVRARRT